MFPKGAFFILHAHQTQFGKADKIKNAKSRSDAFCSCEACPKGITAGNPKRSLVKREKRTIPP
jgi:hypothetical protein